MKKFLFFLALAAGILTVSCNKERFPYEKGELPSGTQFFFPVGTETKYKLAEEMTGIDFTVKRVVKDAAKSIQIAVTDTSKTVFASGTGTLTAAFAAGSDAATITLPIDYAKYEYGDLFGFDFKINEETTPYAPSSLHFEIELPEPWKSLGMALYRDNIIAGYYSFEPVEYEVEMLENELTPGYYRLVNPYGEAFPKNEEGQYDTDKDYYMEIHAEDPTAVWIPVRKSNIHWSDGYFYMGSIAGYYIEYAGSNLAAQKEAGNTGTLENGIITFPANTLLVGEENYNNGNLYTTNAAGMFRVVLPGVVPADYTMSIDYLGIFTGKAGDIYACADVDLAGADIASAKAALAFTADPAEVLALIENGDEGVIDVKEGGEIRLQMPEEAASGKYTIVIVAYDSEGKAQASEYVTFKYTSPNAGDAALPVPVDEEFTTDDIVGAIDMESFLATEWDIYAIPQDQEGEWLDGRYYIGGFKFQPDEEENFVSVAGLGGGDYYGYDDALHFELYSGVLYSQHTGLGQFNFNQTTIYVNDEYLTSDGKYYTASNALVGFKVDDGLIAFAGNPGYKQQYGLDFIGVSFELYDTEDREYTEYEDESTNYWGSMAAYSYFLFADPNIYEHPEEDGSSVTSLRKVEKQLLPQKSFKAYTGPALSQRPELKVNAKAAVIASGSISTTLRPGEFVAPIK